MKATASATRILLLIILIQIALLADGQGFLTNGLVAYYPLDGSAVDASGNGNSGIINGSTLSVPDRFGQTNGALVFGGFLQNLLSGSPYSDLPVTNGSTFDFSADFTISSWVDITNMTDPVSIFDTSGYDLGVVLSSNGLALYFTNTLSHSPLIQVGLTAQQYFPTSNWTHVVGRRQNGILSVFVNGSLSGQTSVDLVNDYSQGPGAAIGVDIDSYEYLDDVRVYNRGLSDKEIAELYVFEAGTNYLTCPRAALATSVIVNGFLVGIEIIDDGCGYDLAAPGVEILGGGGSGASATASVTNGVVTSIKIANAGRGYTTAPAIIIPPPSQTLAISSPYPCTASGDSAVVNGFVVQINLIDGGCGYTNPPAIQIVGGGGTGATATCTVTNGTITNISVEQAGSGYTNNPAVIIAAPTPPLNRVTITQTLVFGHSYALESSTNLQDWATLQSLNATYTGVTQQQIPLGAKPTFFRTRLVQ